MTDEHSRQVFEVLSKAKVLAQDYYRLTKKPLGVTGEIAEYECARLLDLKLTEARTAGYDAVRLSDGRRFQIKGRYLRPSSKQSQRVGGVKIDKEFDAVLLVLLDECFNATAIYEADRAAIVAAIVAPGSKARNEDGALAVSKFKSIARQVWPTTGVADDRCCWRLTTTGFPSAAIAPRRVGR